MKVKVLRVSKRDTDKNGIKLVSKQYGTPYYNIGIQVEGSEEWMSAFANKTSDPVYNIEEGGTYHISVVEKKVGDRTFKNFKMLSPEEVELEEYRALKAKGLANVNPTTFEPTSAQEAVTSVEEEIDLNSF